MKNTTPWKPLAATLVTAALMTACGGGDEDSKGDNPGDDNVPGNDGNTNPLPPVDAPTGPGAPQLPGNP